MNNATAVFKPCYNTEVFLSFKLQLTYMYHGSIICDTFVCYYSLTVESMMHLGSTTATVISIDGKFVEINTN